MDGWMDGICAKSQSRAQLRVHTSFHGLHRTFYKYIHCRNTVAARFYPAQARHSYDGGFSLSPVLAGGTDGGRFDGGAAGDGSTAVGPVGALRSARGRHPAAQLVRVCACVYYWGRRFGKRRLFDQGERGRVCWEGGFWNRLVSDTA